MMIARKFSRASLSKQLFHLFSELNPTQSEHFSSPSSFPRFLRNYLRHQKPSSEFGRSSASSLHLRCSGVSSIELNTDEDIVRFSVDSSEEKKREPRGKANGAAKKGKKKMSKRAKVNELKLFRLLARKKMRSPNPEVRIRYKLEKAKRKEVWLIEKLRKFDVLKAPPETHDPEILTEEERFYLKRTGDKKKHYVPVGRRGVFGGVVLNMHLHWKNHETVKVVCRPCRPGQVQEYAAELSRLSNGIVIDIKPNNTILFYRGKNYVQPEVMSPPDTLSKAKALEKYRLQQSLEHTSQFIEKLEAELEEYREHLARYKKDKENPPSPFDYLSSPVDA